MLPSFPLWHTRAREGTFLTLLTQSVVSVAHRSPTLYRRRVQAAATATEAPSCRAMMAFLLHSTPWGQAHPTHTHRPTPPGGMDSTYAKALG